MLPETAEGRNRSRLGRRREAFKAALRAAKMTQRQWADDHGVTRVHLYLVLEGQRDSRRLELLIDAFIAEHAGAPAAA